VSLTKQATACEIRVRDAGPGVEASQLEVIFDPFTRTAEARERGSGGFGLGLAIARRAMLIHGGDAAARNHPQGGLEVSLRLPL
jgi:signal transduction histidine kinase